MDRITLQKLIYFSAWLATIFFILAIIFTSDLKYGYCAIAFAILTHSENMELRYRQNERDE